MQKKINSDNPLKMSFTFFVRASISKSLSLSLLMFFKRSKSLIQKSCNALFHVSSKGGKMVSTIEQFTTQDNFDVFFSIIITKPVINKSEGMFRFNRVRFAIKSSAFNVTTSCRDKTIKYKRVDKITRHKISPSFLQGADKIPAQGIKTH